VVVEDRIERSCSLYDSGCRKFIYIFSVKHMKLGFC
jgi:hypothetical protein